MTKLRCTATDDYFRRCYGERGRRLAISAAVALASTVFSISAMAQTQVRILCGFPPGGSADLFARLLADELSKETGDSYIVDNRPGANGALAAEALKFAPKDGKTLLVTPDTALVVYPHAVKQPRYDPVRDFQAVAMLGTYNLAFTVSANSPYRDLRSYVAAAKTDSSVALYGSPGSGGLPHLYGFTVGKALGVPWTHVPYKGAAPLMTDVLGGTTPSMIAPLVSVMEQAKAGKLRVLATSDSTRSPRAPNVPTFAELGYPQASHIGWFGLFAPAGTPAAIIDALNAKTTAILRKPNVLAKLAAMDSDNRTMDAQSFSEFVRKDSERWRAVIKEIGFSMDTQ